MAEAIYELLKAWSKIRSSLGLIIQEIMSYLRRGTRARLCGTTSWRS